MHKPVISALPQTTVGDHEWSRTSTTEERGKALLEIALEWSGDGAHDLDEREVVGHSAESLISILALATSRFGDRVALKIFAEVMDRAEEWGEQE